MPFKMFFSCIAFIFLTNHVSFRIAWNTTLSSEQVGAATWRQSESESSTRLIQSWIQIEVSNLWFNLESESEFQQIQQKLIKNCCSLFQESYNWNDSCIPNISNFNFSMLFTPCRSLLDLHLPRLALLVPPVTGWLLSGRRCGYRGVSKNWGTPKWMVYKGKPYWNRWFGGTTIFGTIHMMIQYMLVSWTPERIISILLYWGSGSLLFTVVRFFWRIKALHWTDRCLGVTGSELCQMICHVFEMELAISSHKSSFKTCASSLANNDNLNKAMFETQTQHSMESWSVAPKNVQKSGFYYCP